MTLVSTSIAQETKPYQPISTILLFVFYRIRLKLDLNWPRMDLARCIAGLDNGLGSRGDEESNPLVYPQRPLHILLATSGSVASIKLPLIVDKLLQVSFGPIKAVLATQSYYFSTI